MRRLFAMLLCLCMLTSLFMTTALAEEPSGAFKLGLGVSLSTSGSRDGNAQVDATTAAVVLDDEGRIVAAKIDVAQNKMDVSYGEVDPEAAFPTKLEKGEDYGMRGRSPIEKEWFEQAEAFEQYVTGKTVEEIEAMETETLENGHVVSVDPELLAGCTISIGEFKEALLKACKDEQGMTFEAEGEFKLGLAIISTADESKPATNEEDGVVKMYSEYAAVVVDENGVILAALTDATQPQIIIDGDGAIVEARFAGTKRELMDDYGMRSRSPIEKEWFEQAAAFEQYAVGKTAEELRATGTMVLPNGHVIFADEELYASCSISIQGMIDVVAKAADNTMEPAAALIKVGIITLDPTESGYRQANVKDLTDTFTVENGYDATFVTAPTGDRQLEAARGFIAAQVKYILVSPAETTGWDEVLQEAKDAGIQVILFDRMIDCDPSLYTAAVVSDMRVEGETAVAWLESLGLEEYRILHIQGQLGSAAQIGRSDPLLEKCEADEKWTIVREGTGGDSWDPNEARKIAEAAIDAGEEFNIVYAENDGMAQGVVEALDAAGITHGVNGDVIIMSFDCNKWALEKLLAGEWNYDGQCSPFQAVVLDKMIKTLEAGGQIEGLNTIKQYINEEKGFDARTITREDVETYGLGY